MELFYVLKLNTSYIVGNNLDIHLDYNDAVREHLVVALGDNQLFKFIRRLRGNEDILTQISDVKKTIQILHKQNTSETTIRQLSALYEQLDLLMFVPDIISVKADTTKKDYKMICKNMFKVTIKIAGRVYTKKYKRLCAGAGQLRRNSALFVDADLYNELESIMMCGLTKSKIGKINLAKFSAYFSLYTSASRQVRTPRICVVDDFEYPLHNQLVDWVYDNEDGEKDVEERLIDFEINAFDGAGIISPQMAMNWQNDLNLDYTPASFIIRSAWIKGLVSVFDFHKFAKEVAHTDTITDLWGETYNVSDVDVILTASQFKMWKKYESWSEYVYYHKTFGHIFSVARVNKKEDNVLTTLNYQYIQTNNFTEESIKGLAEYSINWAKKIMSKDYLYTLLLLLPKKDPVKVLDESSSTLDDMLTKALLYCPNLMNDTYFNQRMIHLIQNKIDKMKIGKLYVEGAYEFIIPDLYALCEHAFRLPVKGLLPANSLWNRRWTKKGSTKVTAHRSPLVAPSENRILDVYNDELCEKWFGYLYSGNVVNIWDMTLIAMSDADCDGDLIVTTDNPYMIEAVGENGKVITYDKVKAKEHTLNMNAFATMDTKSFNSKIGVITNIASNMISLKSVYSPDSDEYKELDRRIKLLRYFQGSAIDATKGDVFIPPPKLWSKKQKFVKITDDMSPETVEQIKSTNQTIAFNNRIAVDRKAYFFGYVYPNLKKEYDLYVKSYRALCRQLYHSTISQLSHKENKSPREAQIVKSYYKYMPLARNNCTMNLLAYYVEDVEFDNKWKRSSTEPFDYTLLLSKYFTPSDTTLLKQIKQVMSEEFSFYNKQLKELLVDDDIVYDPALFDEMSQNLFRASEKCLRDRLYALSSNAEDVANYVVYCYYNYFNNKSKSWMWSICGEQILNNLRAKASSINVVVECEDGVEYLGKHYKVERRLFDDYH